MHKIQTESIESKEGDSRSRDHEDRDHRRDIARSKDQEDRDRHHDERCQGNFIDRNKEDKDQDRSRSSSRDNEGRFRDRSIHDRSSRQTSGSSDEISRYRSDNYRNDYRFSYRDRSPAGYRVRSPTYYRDRSADRYPQMSRGNNCSKSYNLSDRYCDKCSSIMHHAFDCRKYRRWSFFDCKICNLGRRHWPEDCKEMEIDAILSEADTGISVVPSINTRNNECQKN